jgi:hypothetical protein
MDCILSYIEKHPQDTLKFKLLVINLLEYFAKQTTNQVDDELVYQIKKALFSNHVMTTT